MELLEKKFEAKSRLKKEKLEVRRMEVTLQSKKREMEEKERRQRLEIEAEQSQSFIDLVKNKLVKDSLTYCHIMNGPH